MSNELYEEKVEGSLDPGLISSRIARRSETYYPVTKDQLELIESQGMLFQIILVFASVFGGGFLTILLSIFMLPALDEMNSLQQYYRQKLWLAFFLFLLFAIILSIIGAIAYKSRSRTKNLILNCDKSLIG